MPIKSFRGKIAGTTGKEQDIISLHTNDGSTGYRIKKFQVMPEDPFTGNTESVCIYFTDVELFQFQDRLVQKEQKLKPDHPHFFP